MLSLRGLPYSLLLRGRKKCAFAMGLRERLGVQSVVRYLDIELVETILKYMDDVPGLNE